MGVTRLRFSFTPADAGDRMSYIDLAQCLSIQERKLHRQFRHYTVLGGLLQDSNNGTYLRINTAPVSWVTNVALRRGFRLWTKMNRQAMEGQPGQVRPKYHDWKVYLNEHHQQGAGQLIPQDAGGNGLVTGEWLYSKYVSEDPDQGALVASGLANPNNANMAPDQFYAHIVGPHIAGPGAATSSGDNWTSVGLIESWRDSRPQPDPDSPDINTQAELIGDPLANLFDEGDTVDEVLQNLDITNDEPPYGQDDVFGARDGVSGNLANLQRQAMAMVSSANPIVPFNGFVAPCGLIQIHTTQATVGELTLLLDVDTQGVKV